MCFAVALIADFEGFELGLFGLHLRSSLPNWAAASGSFSSAPRVWPPKVARARLSSGAVRRIWLSRAREGGLMRRVVSGVERSETACRQAAPKGGAERSNGADSVFHETIQCLVFAHVFAEVFLISSGEHSGG